MSFQIYPATSDKPETCWRCHTLGLDSDKIPVHQKYIAVAVGGEIKGSCCIPCWNKISEFVKVNPAMERKEG